MARPEISVQPIDKRIKNFSEVTLGLNKKQALEEAIRCPQCAKSTCLKGCPIGIDIPAFIRKIRESDPVGALDKIREKNPLAGICGRICTAPCEKACILNEEDASPISIKALERFASDFGDKKKHKSQAVQAREQKIAIAGSGPCALTAAADLAGLGFSVTLFEFFPALGGILRYGIPEFRLPKKNLDSELSYLQSLGVNFRTNILVGQTYSIEDLLKEFSALYLSVGLDSPKSMGMNNERLNGVYYAIEFLIRVHSSKEISAKKELPFYLGKQIAVIGKGDQAVDCARVCVRLGRPVTLIFERTEDEMNVFADHLKQAAEEGVKIEVMTRSLEILADEQNFPKGIKCIKMDFADPDHKGQWRLVAVKGSEYTIEADTVILTVDLKANPLLSQLDESLKMNKDGSLWCDKNSFQTSLPGVFTRNSQAKDPSDMVHVMGEAKKAAVAISQYLSKQ